jgi:hypothetical protein
MADALGWGPSGGNPVEVQVLSAAPKRKLKNKLTSIISICYYYQVAFKTYAPVAQLDRAFDYGSKGYGFDSFRARHIIGK